MVDTHTTVIISGHTDLGLLVDPTNQQPIHNTVSLQYQPNKALNSYHDTSSWITCQPPAIVLCGYNVRAWQQFAPKLPNPIFCTRHLKDMPGADFISYVQ